MHIYRGSHPIHNQPLLLLHTAAENIGFTVFQKTAFPPTRKATRSGHRFETWGFSFIYHFITDPGTGRRLHHAVRKPFGRKKNAGIRKSYFYSFDTSSLKTAQGAGHASRAGRRAGIFEQGGQKKRYLPQEGGEDIASKLLSEGFG